MKCANMRIAAFIALVCAALNQAAARTWEVKNWANGSSVNRFTYAVNNASDGDILELQNDVRVNSDVEIRKKITVKSVDGSTYKITNRGYTYGVKIHPGASLTMTNITYDCQNMSQVEDVFLLMARTVSGSITNISRMVLNNGATIKNATLSSSTRNENAVIHVKEGAVLWINEGAAILNCTNNSNPGKGGAICCDYGTVIMTGGTIAGCTAKGAGGAIHTDGTRVENVDNYGLSSRGDIYISGGYITNNYCAAGYYGGGIYLGNSGPVLHITGTAVISNNFSGSRTDSTKVADDVSTYLLQNAYANRLKLVDYHESHPDGFTFAGEQFTGWVGVRYPKPEEMKDPQHTRFGAVWEYFNGNQEEARQFFWNGDNEFRGKIDANALVWSKHVIHELPKDGAKVADLILNEESPIYMELSDDYKMDKAANIPPNMELVIDLKGFNFKCDFHISNTTSRVRIFDSSTNKSGTVTGHRDSDSANAFLLEGGSYATLPKPEWVASNCVVVGNYCTEHPYMVAIKVWDAEHKRVVTDLTNVHLAESDNEIRSVERKADGSFDIGRITFSTGDWKFMQYTNMDYRVQVLAAPAVECENGSISECGPRVLLFDTHESEDIAPSAAEANGENWAEGENFGREDDFGWSPGSYGLIKLIHITTRKDGGRTATNAVEQAYFRFPEAAFSATQRKAGVGVLPITVVDSLLTALGYNRADGFHEQDVNNALDNYEPNGLRKWENIVTGTAENQLLLSTAAEDEGGLSLQISLADDGKTGRTDTGYFVRYDLRKCVNGAWTRVGEITDRPSFSVPLLSDEGKSVDASGFYRVTTLIIPGGELAVTNEIPSTNIVGVLEVASTLTNTLTAVPWVSLAQDPANDAPLPITVSNYVMTTRCRWPTRGMSTASGTGTRTAKSGARRLPSPAAASNRRSRPKSSSCRAIRRCGSSATIRR